MTTKATRDVIDLASRAITAIVITGGSADGMPIGVTTPSTGAFTNLSATTATFTNLTASGNINFTNGTLTGSLKANYGDIAEYYHANRLYEPGTLVQIGGECEITEAQIENPDGVFGVVTNDEATIYLNADQDPEKLWVPVALVGRVGVRVLGPVRKGNRLILSELPGVAVAALAGGWSIGRALEDNNEPGERLIKCVVRISV